MHISVTFLIIHHALGTLASSALQSYVPYYWGMITKNLCLIWVLSLWKNWLEKAYDFGVVYFGVVVTGDLMDDEARKPSMTTGNVIDDETK